MMRRITALLALPLIACSWATAQMVQPEELEQGFVIVVDDVARMATRDMPMFLASNFGGWDPAKPEFEMTPRSDGRWQYVFDSKPDRTGTLQFKFTLGSWDRVETTPDGTDIDNRTLPKVDAAKLNGEKPLIEVTVPRFRSPSDIASQRQSTQYRDIEVTGTLRRLQVAGGAGGASGMMRDLLVWLPPGYDAPENVGRRYPVLYMFDGQNLFENHAGVPGEWGVDETADKLIRAGQIQDLIVVGVPHAGEFRAEEYLAFGGGRGAEPHGAEFASWFMSEVMARVERAFRVSTDVSETGVGGASYGAAISLYIATQHSDRFGRLLLESMPPIGNSYIADAPGWPERVYVGVGGKELGDDERVAARNLEYESWNRSLATRLENAGLGRDRLLLVLTPDATHNELAWAGRLPQAMRFLFSVR